MPPTSERLCPDPPTILERSRGLLFAQWDELLQLRRAVMKSFDPGDIHDLRVASRRFRAILELYDPFAKGSRAELRKGIRKLTRNLGRLRNIDEALLFFRTRIHADGRAAGDVLCRKLSKRRSAELKQIRKTLAAFDHRSFERQVQEMIDALNDTSITGRNISLPAYFSDVSTRLFEPIEQRLALSINPGHGAARHALRIAIKKWRYFLEIVAQTMDRDHTSLLEQLKEYQALLGQMNDMVEFGLLVGTLKLSRKERESAEEIICCEDTRLLKCFMELIEQKPLTGICMM